MSPRLTKENENQERGFSDEGNTGILACGKKGQREQETDIYNSAIVNGYFHLNDIKGVIEIEEDKKVYFNHLLWFYLVDSIYQ